MDWYCDLTEHLLNKDNIVVGSESFETILQQLEKRVVVLYKARSPPVSDEERLLLLPEPRASLPP